MENELWLAIENMSLADNVQSPDICQLTMMMDDLGLIDESQYHEKYYNNNFKKLNFEGAYLPSTLFKTVAIEDCNFSSSHSGEIKAIDCSLFDINYNFIKIPKLTFISSYLQNCSFDGMDGELAIERSNIEGGFFDGQLARGKFNDVNFKDFTFGRTLVDLVLTNCEFIGCYFDFSDLRNPMFINCKFNDCSFEGVSSYDGYFDSCIFVRCVFNGSMWGGSTFSSCHFEICEDVVSLSYAKLIATTSTNGILEYLSAKKAMY